MAKSSLKKNSLIPMQKVSFKSKFKSFSKLFQKSNFSKRFFRESSQQIKRKKKRNQKKRNDSSAKFIHGFKIILQRSQVEILNQQSLKPIILNPIKNLIQQNKI